MTTKKLTEDEVRQIAKLAHPTKTPHSVKGISVTSQTVKRDARTGRFILVPRKDA